MVGDEMNSSYPIGADSEVALIPYAGGRIEKLHPRLGRLQQKQCRAVGHRTVDNRLGSNLRRAGHSPHESDLSVGTRLAVLYHDVDFLTLFEIKRRCKRCLLVVTPIVGYALSFDLHANTSVGIYPYQIIARLGSNERTLPYCREFLVGRNKRVGLCSAYKPAVEAVVGRCACRSENVVVVKPRNPECRTGGIVKVPHRYRRGLVKGRTCDYKPVETLHRRVVRRELTTGNGLIVPRHRVVRLSVYRPASGQSGFVGHQTEHFFISVGHSAPRGIGQTGGYGV
ncbi:hypothetical protein IMSAG192_00657 [Muribaculaceae bacterium]|nr:hypothetical protein IMSAG192_00657 [Muribaculaceae bacterium]